MPVCLLAYALAYVSLRACVLTPRSLQDTISPLNEKFFTFPANRLFTGGFWKQNMCLVVIFPGFERLLVNRFTSKQGF